MQSNLVKSCQSIQAKREDNRRNYAEIVLKTKLIEAKLNGLGASN
ncbi:MAG: hypothetical protein RLZZ511_3449 [Cyanobacteriota bacterium]|jgi:hypothetical protein